MRRLDLELIIGIIAVAIVAVAIFSLVLNYTYMREPEGDWSQWFQLVSSITSLTSMKIDYEKEYNVSGNISLHAIVSNGGLVVFDNMSSNDKLKIIVVEKPIEKEPKAYFINVSGTVVDVRVDGYTLYIYAPRGSIVNIDCNGINSGLLISLNDSRNLHYFMVNIASSGAKIILRDLANTTINLDFTTSGVEALFYYHDSGSGETYSSIDFRLKESGAKIGIVALGYAFNINFEGSMSGARIVVGHESFSATGKWFYVDNDYSLSNKRIDIRLYAEMSGVKLWVKKNK